MFRFIGIVAAAFSSFLACAPIVNAQASPTLEVGDTWRYRQLNEKTGVSSWVLPTPDFALIYANRAGDLVFAIKPRSQGTPVWQPLGPVAPSTCLFDVVARRGITNRCDTPLKLGITWTTDETTSIARTQELFEVGESEDVTVPAGKYHALKIQSQKTVTEFAMPGVAAPLGGYVKQFKTT